MATRLVALHNLDQLLFAARRMRFFQHFLARLATETGPIALLVVQFEQLQPAVRRWR